MVKTVSLVLAPVETAGKETEPTVGGGHRTAVNPGCACKPSQPHSRHVPRWCARPRPSNGDSAPFRIHAFREAVEPNHGAEGGKSQSAGQNSNSPSKPVGPDSGEGRSPHCPVQSPASPHCAAQSLPLPQPLIRTASAFPRPRSWPTHPQRSRSRPVCEHAPTRRGRRPGQYRVCQMPHR